jgi:hypothetical protein
MSALLGVIGGVLLAAALVTGVLLGGDELPLAVMSCGFAIAGGLALLGCAIVEAAQARKSRV